MYCYFTALDLYLLVAQNNAAAPAMSRFALPCSKNGATRLLSASKPANCEMTRMPTPPYDDEAAATAPAISPSSGFCPTMRLRALAHSDNAKIAPAICEVPMRMTAGIVRPKIVGSVTPAKTKKPTAPTIKAIASSRG